MQKLYSKLIRYIGKTVIKEAIDNDRYIRDKLWNVILQDRLDAKESKIFSELSDKVINDILDKPTIKNIELFQPCREDLKKRLADKQKKQNENSN